MDEHSFTHDETEEYVGAVEEVATDIPVMRLEDAFDDIAADESEEEDNYEDDENKAAAIEDKEDRGGGLDLEVGQSQPSVEPKSMKVFLRVRPINSNKDATTVNRFTDTGLVTVAPSTSNRAKYTKTEERHYEFNKVFGPDSDQTHIYLGMVDPLQTRFLNGDSCVAFAYGMTNSGKTHTIQGTKQDPGVLPRLVRSVLERMEGKADWELRVSMLEIYNEHIYDLLGRKKEKLKIRDMNGRIDVTNLSSHSLLSEQESIKLMDKAAKARSKSRTLLNTGSSRSHAIYTLSLTQIIAGREVSSLFQVVDLAGAERMNRTKASSTQVKEANNINTSLMQLWRCLHAMSRKSDNLIPFRECKLTHLLMPLLGRAGLDGVAMIACVNPRAVDYDETISILSNASIACTIQEISDIESLRDVKAVQAAAERAAVRAAAKVAKAAAVAGAADKADKKKRTSSLVSEMTMDTAILQAARLSAAAQSQKQETGETVNEEAFQIIDDLQNEVERLEEENEQLRMEMVQRETAIRIEVSEEMAERGQHLLEQIEDLQSELHSLSAKDYDVGKSVRKVRKRLQAGLNADVAKNLEEVEEELVRVREQYEQELAQTKDEKNMFQKAAEQYKGEAAKMAQALEKMKAKMDAQTSRESTISVLSVMEEAPVLSPALPVHVSVPAAAAVVEHMAVPPAAPVVETSVVETASMRFSISSRAAELRAESGAKVVPKVLSGSTSGKADAGEAFSKRMKRDGRFVKNGGVAKSPLSLKRSPLQAVSVANDENSPLGAAGRSVSKSKLPGYNAKKRKSEDGDANPSSTKRPYLSRLRSQFATAQ